MTFSSPAGQTPQALTANDGRGHLKRLEESLVDILEVSYAGYTQLGCSMSTLDTGVDLSVGGQETQQGGVPSSRVSPDLL